ncbi:LLM class flavin-dependent oxidoreductase [Pseudomonas nitroreducens]|uniref:LLM class flavin-dependent oxidoreductase n=1 Tax=Pseudomonas nitroreducens TaxID=46680 RepID=UPI001FB79983|nr:LLM class flavin-dependent oxidoreductase [Pseudomonas nitroreducens]MCJ1882625.1 LLM class flavin-dependent oxidoreductase [Pseudomonas nitroreducens]MCJ1895333.1 LLM class flavin-dependent oxidoreductase [Pseudomonas nitroreducens]
MTAPRQMALGAFLMATGHHLAGWRHPGAHAAGGLDVGHYRALARTAERGCLDAIFLSDTLAMLPGRLEALSRMARTEHFEPLTLLAHLAVSTRHIGLVATVTSSYNDAANVADTFATLESLSGGRSGWNLVTSSNAEEARNFGRDRHYEHACRYRMAEDFLQRVRERWAALGVAPVQVLAGASEVGRDLAARHAEVLFTAQPELTGAQAFYRDIKQRAARNGRDPDALKVMPGVLPILGACRAEAEERRAQLQELVQPAVGLSLLSDVAGGFDLSPFPLDGPLPELPPTESGVSRQHLLLDLARREGLSIRQLYQRIADARGHRVIAGTATDVADQLQDWFESGAADGFNIMPPYLPGGLDDFVAQVVPQLQHRGVFRRCYSGRTLRAHLGLAHRKETAEHG